ncbi:MAG: protein kinase domain-containing protein, partial [Vicinamibacterales bacterium]
MSCNSCGAAVSSTATRCLSCGALVPAGTRDDADGGIDALTPIPDSDDVTRVSVDPDANTRTDITGGGLTTRDDATRDDATRDDTTRASAGPSGSAACGPLDEGQAFGSRYHIIRALGVGGMGAVYQAWDAELGIAVAIKVIRPDTMADPEMAAQVERRFKRELLLARQVTHKNVVRIYDLGEIDGIKYITMSYVDGVDLASMLKRDGRLPVPVVMRIARDVVAGLLAAHKAGVVHRDLKPANI